MAYLPDVGCFLAVMAGLIVLDLCFWSEQRSTSENLLLPGGLFVGGYALLIWSVGLAGKLVPGLWISLPWPILLVLALLRRRNFVDGVRRLSRCRNGLQLEDYCLLLYLVVAGAISFALTLLPPSGAEYDALTYHLGAPAQYLRHGRIIELQYDHHSYFPFTVEMWFLLGLAAKGPVLAKLFHWMMLPAGALALLAIGSRHDSRRMGLWAAVIYVSIPLVLIESTTAYIDLGFTAFALLAALCFLRATEENSLRWSVASGAFCGFCMGSKYLGGLFLVFFSAWLVVAVARKQVRPVNLIGFVMPALLLGMPWYIRNFFWTGDPVFPFGYSVFHSPKWTAEMAKAYAEDQAKFGFGKSPIDLLILPWRLAMTPLNVAMPFWPLTDGPIASENGKYGFFEVPGLVLTACPGPIWLALGMPAFFIPRKSRAVWFCLALILFLSLFWVVTSHQVRYYLPALALFGLAGAYTLVRADRALRLSPRVIRGGLVLWLLFSLCFFVRQGRSSWDVVLGRVSPETYLTGFGGYLPMKWASTALPPNAKVAVYGEPRCFYLQRDYFWADREHSTLIDYAKVKTPEDLVRALRGQGATHVLCALAGAAGAFGSPPPAWNEALDQGLIVKIAEMNHYGIYEIR